MSTRSQQIITLAAVRSLNITDSIPDSKKPVIWKEFGAYLEKRLEIHNKTDIESSTKSSLIVNSHPDNSYLNTNINFKICNSCKRPIGEKNLTTHYQKCLEMSKQRLSAAAAERGGTPSSLKRKRGRGALLDMDTSSVDSSRNTTPIPGIPVSIPSSSSGKPKKKYKKSQTQREKEAANAAAAASTTTAGTSETLRKDSEVAQSVPTPVVTSPGSVASKRKKQPKPKTVAKPKGPVDVEKQCGVPLPSGGFCARSLTCKTHSMGAKRAVLGRSAPYDILLQQYQKRNQAKIAASNALAAQRRENAEFNGAELNDEMNGLSGRLLDPDEETHLVLEGLSKNNPMPLERKIILPVRNRHRFLSSREFYANALIMSSGSNKAAAANTSANGTQSTEQTLANQAISGSIGGLQGRCALINVDAVPLSGDSVTQSFSAIPGEMYQVRAPLKAILMTAQQNVMQQQAFQQQILKLQKQQQQQMLLLKQRQVRMQAQQQQTRSQGSGQPSIPVSLS